MSGLAKFVDLNRRVMICGHSFILYYFTQSMAVERILPLVCFDYRFVNGVYQLIIGRKWSNKDLFDERMRATITISFNEFKRLIPNAMYTLVPSTVQPKAPTAFTSILTSTAK